MKNLKEGRANAYAAVLYMSFDIPEEDGNAVELLVSSNEVQTAISQFLTAMLTPREEHVVRSILGIGCKPMTLKAVSERFGGLSVARIQTSRKRAEKKMKEISSPKGKLTETLISKGGGFSWLEQVIQQEEKLQILSWKKPVANPQFGRDCTPSCTGENPCPTCRVRAILKGSGILHQFDELMKEYFEAQKEGVIPIEGLPLPVRTKKCFEMAGVDTLEKALGFTEAEFLRIPNMGRKSLNEFKALCMERGWHR